MARYRYARVLAVGTLVAIACFAGGPAVAAEAPSSVAGEPSDFGHLDFEELKKVKVVTASRTEESLFGLPAAARVVTPVDIRRSGARSLPEVLRMVPGVEVGRVNSRSYLVTVRGFNGTAANKLLPMIDGRSIYSARFSGTIWDARDVMLEDIERIEVIRGPGGTAWGANAVNGVINVLTRDARETQGTLVRVAAGTLERAEASVRHGFALGGRTWMRVFARGFARGETSRLDGGDANDAWNLGRGGFRLDARRGERAHWTVMGDVFTSDADQVLPPAIPSTAQTSGGVLQVRGRFEGARGQVTRLNVYYDRLHRNSGGLESDAAVVEADLQHELPAAGRHRLAAGLNARLSRLEDGDATVGGVASSFDPSRRDLKQAGVFVQDQVALVPSRLVATAGCKLEYDDFTGLSPLPALRLAWTPTTTHTLWAAVSRATRIPSRSENDQTTVSPGPVVSSPNPGLDPEQVVAWEAGWRTRPAGRLTLDLAAYYNHYRDLFASVTTLSPLPATSRLSNAVRGESWGAEVEVTWLPADWWQLEGSLSWVEIALRRADASVSRSGELAECLSPAAQGSLRSSWTFGRGVEADLGFRHVGELPGSTAPLPAYSSLDARVSWQPLERLQASVSGRDLLEPLHQEFRFFVTRWEIPRSVTGELTVRF